MNERGYVICCTLLDWQAIGREIIARRLGKFRHEFVFTNRRESFNTQSAIIILIGDDYLTVDRVAAMLDDLQKEPDPTLFHSERLVVLALDSAGTRVVLTGRRGSPCLRIVEGSLT